MRIDERPIGDAILLDLHGKIVAGDAAMHDAVQSAIARGYRHVLLNFADVSYMDSVGLSTLVRSHLSLRPSGGILALVHVPRHIAALVTATGLAEIFKTFDDESAALRHIRSFDPPSVGATSDGGR